MTDNKSRAPAASPGEAFRIVRVFDAPRALVWKAHTEAERLAQWWGPKGFGIRVAKLDLRPGGIFHYAMILPDGKEVWGKFVYREVAAPERLVWVNSFSDANEGITRHFMSADWPLEMLITLTLAEQGGKTTLTLTNVALNATEAERKTFVGGFASMQQGFGGTYDQLEAYLAKPAAKR